MFWVALAQCWFLQGVSFSFFCQRLSPVRNMWFFCLFFWTRIVSGKGHPGSSGNVMGRKLPNWKLNFFVRAGGEGVAVGLFDPQKYQGHQHTEALVGSNGVFRIYYKGISREFRENFWTRKRKGSCIWWNKDQILESEYVSDFSLTSYFFFTVWRERIFK